jgi:cytochrome c oxidase subunit 3
MKRSPLRRRRALPDSLVMAKAREPALQHHFADLGQQRDASSLGMWLFLAPEIMFFGRMLAPISQFR